MRNKVVIFIFVIIFTLLMGIFCFNKFVLQFIWVTPIVKTDVYPYLTATIKEIDKAVKYSVNSTKSENSDIKLIYQNACGSGFLKGNPIPNDLDYTFAVYLGKYDYDGTNAKDIAQKLENLMSSIQIQLYSYVNASRTNKIYSHNDTFLSIQRINKYRDNHIEMIAQSIPELFKHKSYVLYTTKNIPHEDSDKETQITFPFIMNDNEMLVENYDLILLYSNNIKYSEYTRPILREIEIIANFYADIKYGEDIVHVEIIPESVRGKRLQLSKRFYVPNVFIGNYSAKFLKDYSVLNDDEKYIEYRLSNFRYHFQNMKNYLDNKERLIKIPKRILQIIDLICPLLDEKTVQDITDTTINLLNSPQIKLINDYQTAYSNILQISNHPSAYLNIGENDIQKHIDEMQKIVSEMEQTNLFDTDLINEIKLATAALDIKNIKNESDLAEYNSNAKKISKSLDEKLDAIIFNLIYNKVSQYPDIFFEPMKKAGFHQVDMCWLDKNLMGIVKDDFTSKIPANKLKDMAKQNNLIDVEYKHISKEEASGPKIRYTVWVRYNSTKEENKAWENIKAKLIQDKQNFNMKRTFTFAKNL